jgi:hypothetical protein
MAKEQKPTVPEFVAPAFGVTCPVTCGTVGATVIAYGWCQEISAASHRIKCQLFRTSPSNDTYTPVDATLYCGDPPTLWQVELPTTEYPVAAGDKLKVVFSLWNKQGTEDSADDTLVGSNIERSDLTVSATPPLPVPTECPDDAELELEEFPQPGFKATVANNARV